MGYALQVSKELYKYLYGLYPSGKTWDEIIIDLLEKAGMPFPKRAGKPSLNEIRKVCQHPNPVIKTGLYPNPEEKWLYCPNCDLLLELVT